MPLHHRYLQKAAGNRTYLFKLHIQIAKEPMVQRNHDGSRSDFIQSELLTVFTGKLQPLGLHGVPSGILKQPCADGVYIRQDGLSGDEQGDRRYHGGPEKAVHHYALDHYVLWRAELPARAALFDQSGVFGENFSTLGLTEANVNVGDIFQVGEAVLQVSQARQPCWRLNARTLIPNMAMRLQATGRTGWYYRVIHPGWVRSGDTLRLLERPNPDWPLQKVLHYLYTECLNRAALIDIADLPFLADSWRRLARIRLERNAVEDWSKRLNSP
jgi:MOSC domain-containing protein YiiM